VNRLRGGKQSLRQANTDRLNRAIDAIMAHNNAPDRRHDQKWAISISILKNYVNSQPKILRILDQRKDEISAHHATHQINPIEHNKRHRGKQTITEVIPLPSDDNQAVSL
jgi:hypothetical protein